MNWKQAASAVAALGGAFACVYYAFNIYDLMQRPHPEVVATVSFGPIVRVPGDTHAPDTVPPGGFERIVVRNEGSETARDVRLSAPYAMEYEVSSPETPPVRTVLGPSVSLGSMEPLKSYTVTAFLPGFMPGDTGAYQARQVSVVYADGIGKVSLDVPKETPWFGGVDEIVAFVLFPMILLWRFVRPPPPPTATHDGEPGAGPSSQDHG